MSDKTSIKMYHTASVDGKTIAWLTEYNLDMVWLSPWNLNHQEPIEGHHTESEQQVN